MERILAILNREETARAVLAVAHGLGARLDSSTLTVLSPRLPEDPSFLPTEEVMTDDRRRAFNQASGRKAESLRRIFADWQASSPEGPKPRWLEIIGDAEKCVGAEASQADLIVIGHALKDDPSDVRSALHTALFEADVPVIVAPLEPPARVGLHPVIAWEKTEAVEEAIVAALPLLKKAEQVTIVCGNEGHSRPVEVPAGLLELLSSTDVKTDVRPFDLYGREIGQALLEEAEASGGDLLVMGAYTHNAFLERVIGGATAELLARAGLPLFMHH